MDILALGVNFQPLNYLKYFELSWVSQYYTCGSFSIEILAKDLMYNTAYIYAKDRRELGVIQKNNFKSTIQGDFVVLSGFFLEKILDDRIIQPSFIGTGNLETSVRQCFTENSRNLPVMLGAVKGYTEEIGWEREYDEMGKAFYEMLQTQEMTYRCNFIYDTKGMFFELYRGLDRTQSQTVNDFVVFSKGFKNLGDIKIETDSTNHKNFAYVGGSNDENDVQIVAEVDLSNGSPRQEIYIGATSIRYKKTEQHIEFYKDLLVQKGKEKLLEYPKINNLEIDVTQNPFVYMRDFNLGDKVEVMLDGIYTALECRVVTARELFKEGKHTTIIELGNKKQGDFTVARLS